MDISDERIEEFKEIFKKEGKDISDEEARESARNLIGLAEILWEMSKKDAQRQRRLKKEPGGFPVEGSYSCLVCGNGINETTGWYDWYGQTCLLCRDAIRSGVIPAFICKERDSYYATWAIKSKFNIKHYALKKHLTAGTLKARMIMNGDKVHEYIFLKKENPALVERFNPVWKSHQRNRRKLSEKWGREAKEEMKADRARIEKKYRIK